MIIDNDIHNGIKIVNVIKKRNKFYKYNLNNNLIIQTDIKSLIIKIFNIIILVVLFIFLYRGKYIKLIHNKDIYHKYLNVEFDSSNTSFNKAINHLKNCLSPNLVKFQPSLSFKFEEPKISVVIPLYNCQKFILRGVKSIQYQNISEIEIILIEDYSKDNTLSIIEKIQKEDKRVRIIKNKKNMGVLYSRSIGVLSAKGKYLYNEYNYYNRKLFSLIKRTKSILFFLIVIFLLFYSFEKKYFKTNNNINETRVCICTLGKNENRYIKQFLNHYRKLGVDKVFLYDNNDKGNNSESFENEISEFIKEDFVEIINYRGKVHPQFQIYRKCYQKNNQKYDWLIFFDIDELIHLENYFNIKDFLNEKRFNKCKLS